MNDNNFTEEEKILREDEELALTQAVQIMDHLRKIYSDELREHIVKLIEIISGLYQNQK